MIETIKHKEAFDYYFALGGDRGYTKVARKFNTSKTSVAKWSKAFNWLERITQREIALASAMEKKTNSTILDEKAKYRKIVKAMIGKLVKALQQVDSIAPNTMDLERLVKLDLLLMGEAIEKNDSPIIVNVLDEETRVMIGRVSSGERTKKV